MCSDSHKTVNTVCLHYVSYSQAFDDLLLMKVGGEIIYHGPLGPRSINLINYFQAGSCSLTRATFEPKIRAPDDPGGILA